MLITQNIPERKLNSRKLKTYAQRLTPLYITSGTTAATPAGPVRPRLLRNTATHPPYPLTYTPTHRPTLAPTHPRVGATFTQTCAIKLRPVPTTTAAAIKILHQVRIIYKIEKNITPV